MINTKAESDSELAEHLSAIEGVQAESVNSTGYYKRISLVPFTSSLSVTEYKGGGPCIPSDPYRNPGYRIVQQAHEESIDWIKITDKSDGGQTTSWIPDDTH